LVAQWPRWELFEKTHFSSIAFPAETFILGRRKQRDIAAPVYYYFFRIHCADLKKRSIIYTGYLRLLELAKDFRGAYSSDRLIYPRRKE